PSYQYRLIGDSEHWSDWTDESEQNFRSLASGDYRFEVRARGADFQLTPVAGIDFQVTPPWFRSSLAFACYGVCLVGLTIGAIQWRTHSARRRLETLEGVVIERTHDLVEAQEGLERKVAERTTQLSELNSSLLQQIEARQHTEWELAKSEENYRSIVEDQHELIVRFDAEGKIEFANRAFLQANGLTCETLRDANLFDSIRETERLRLRGMLDSITREKSMQGSRLQICRPDGTLEWEDWNIRGLFDDNGALICFQAVSRNVTQLLEAEEKLQQKEEQIRHASRLSSLGEMVAGITHEIRQPLSSISNFAFASQTLLAEEDSEAAKKSHLWIGKICDQVERSNAIISSLRGFARRSDSEFGSISLQSIIDDTLAMLRVDLIRLDVQDIVKATGNVPNVLGDQIQIEQVLVNLIRNSCDALQTLENESGGIVKVSIQVIGDEVVVTVEDNGPGIDASKANDLFEPFNTDKRDGMGLGLAISRSIIEEHGGRIWIDNANPGLAVGFALPIPEAIEDEMAAGDIEAERSP
ncbi:MAG: ATP-binding protein, partial [Pirellulaceae bacterium]